MMLWPMADVSWSHGEQLKCKQKSRAFTESNAEPEQTQVHLHLITVILSLTDHTFIIISGDKSDKQIKLALTTDGLRH